MHRSLLPVFLCAMVAQAADSALLTRIMPDAGLIAGVQVQRVAKTQFGQSIFSHLPTDDDSFQAFKDATGFDPQRDLEEIVIASPDAIEGGERPLMLVRGRFNTERIRTFLGATSSLKKQDVNGTELYLTSGARPQAFAFVGSDLAIAGDQEDVRRALAPQAAGNALLSAKAVELSGAHDAWFVTSNPSMLTGRLNDKRVQGAVQGELFKSIEQSSGGIDFGPATRFAGQAVLKNAEDASSLADVAKFLFNLMQAQGVKGAVGEFVSAISGFDASASGNQVNVVFSVPEAKLQNLLDGPKKAASIEGNSSPAK